MWGSCSVAGHFWPMQFLPGQLPLTTFPRQFSLAVLTQENSHSWQHAMRQLTVQGRWNCPQWKIVQGSIVWVGIRLGSCPVMNCWPVMYSNLAEQSVICIVLNLELWWNMGCRLCFVLDMAQRHRNSYKIISLGFSSCCIYEKWYIGILAGMINRPRFWHCSVLSLL